MTNEEKQAIKEIKYARSFGTSGVVPRWQAIETVLNLIEKQSREIKIKNEYLELMYFLLFDYDGYGTVEGLQGLIDDTVDYIKKATKCDDKSVIYTGVENSKFNILRERIEEDK